MELGELAAAELQPARHLDGHRVDEVRVDQDLEVAMRAGRQAGRADIADDLALLHGDAGRDAGGIARHVAIGGGEAVGVADADVIAVAAFAADLLHGAVAGGEDRRAGGRGPVDAGMHAQIFEQRMAAVAEAGGEAAAFDRIAHQELLGAVALLVVIVDHVVGGAEAVEFARAAPSMVIEV